MHELFQSKLVVSALLLKQVLGMWEDHHIYLIELSEPFVGSVWNH